MGIPEKVQGKNYRKTVERRTHPKKTEPAESPIEGTPREVEGFGDAGKSIFLDQIVGKSQDRLKKELHTHGGWS